MVNTINVLLLMRTRNNLPKMQLFKLGDSGKSGFPPSTAKMVSQNDSNYKESLFRSIGLVS